MNNKNVLEQYIEKERISYDSKVNEIGAEAMRKYGSRYQKWTKRATFHWEALTEDGVEIKESLLEPYPIAFKEFHAAKTMMKYQIRGYNALRELRRTALLCPELLDQGTKYDVLELSSGSCANYEVLTKYNNNVQLSDYMAGRGSCYEPIHKWLDVDIIDFDGGILPFDMADKSYDHILCYQALDAYAEPGDWMDRVLQMERIARKKIVLVFNPDGYRKFASVENIMAEIAQRYKSTKQAVCPDSNLPAMTIDLA